MLYEQFVLLEIYNKYAYVPLCENKYVIYSYVNSQFSHHLEHKNAKRRRGEGEQGVDGLKEKNIKRKKRRRKGETEHVGWLGSGK